MKYQLLHYENLEHKGLRKNFDKITSFLNKGQFDAAQVKKMSPGNFYRAKLNDSARLLFKPVKYQEKTCLLLLEVIRNHDYQKSRFLRGSKIYEEKITDTIHQQILDDQEWSIKHWDGNQRPVHLLDKFLVFDESQEEVFHCQPPLIIIGAAGSGKTSLTLEKLKSLPGEVLYISLSPYLVKNARQLYYAHSYQNNDQQVDFLSFRELLETIEIPSGREVNTNDFVVWHKRQVTPNYLRDGRKVFEEIRGVITGSEPQDDFLSEDKYLKRGVKQSIYSGDERVEVYKLFKKYLSFLENNDLYDSNILASSYAKRIQSRYDAVVVDEVQDFTNSQLMLSLQTLRDPTQFFLCGDANQIVHPNFFSWSSLKSHLFKQQSLSSSEITRILTNNYRNTEQVTAVANQLLRLKHFRFGSIDKESHFLVKSQPSQLGQVVSIKQNSPLVQQLNAKVQQSTHCAIIVLDEAHKEQAREYFNTPLVFSVQEAKGLEYDDVIIYNFLSDEPRFEEISRHIKSSDLDSDFKFARYKDKTDKSLEAYKFYVNALYVALTRAVRNIYWIEIEVEHKFFELLNVSEVTDNLILEIKESSLEEWQQEASRLKMQGKTEQATAIEQQILKQKTPGWDVLTCDRIADLKISAFIEETATKKEKIQLLEYGVIYEDKYILSKLNGQNFKAAKNISKAKDCIDEKYFRSYSSKNTQYAHKEILDYGANFRNTFNFTLLMVAAWIGNQKLINELLDLGSERQDYDNIGRNALHIALFRAITDKSYGRNKISAVYELLLSDSISIQTESRLIKIDASRIEYFMLNFIMSLAPIMTNTDLETTLFTASTFKELMAKLPDEVLPSFRKRQTYISGVLSRNEINSKYSPNRSLFVRYRRGYYVLNPALKIKINEQWLDLHELLKLKKIISTSRLVKNINNATGFITTDDF